jgi:hypothetical protein
MSLTPESLKFDREVAEAAHAYLANIEYKTQKAMSEQETPEEAVAIAALYSMTPLIMTFQTLKDSDISELAKKNASKVMIFVCKKNHSRACQVRGRALCRCKGG